jgi:uncharacterized protein (DUF924 family)
LILASTPRESLTLILLLDQFPRNFSRNSPYPFTTTDPLALQLAEHLVLQKHHDTNQPPYKQFWYYLPFSHNESLPHQELAISKFAESCWVHRVGEWEGYRRLLTTGLESAWEHYEIVKRFGRYPHRNGVLGRETTEEEKKFLEEGGKTFS